MYKTPCSKTCMNDDVADRRLRPLQRTSTDPCLRLKLGSQLPAALTLTQASPQTAKPAHKLSWMLVGSDSPRHAPLCGMSVPRKLAQASAAQFTAPWQGSTITMLHHHVPTMMPGAQSERRTFSPYHSAAGRLDDPGRCLRTRFDVHIRVKLCMRLDNEVRSLIPTHTHCARGICIDTNTTAGMVARRFPNGGGLGAFHGAMTEDLASNLFPKLPPRDAVLIL